MKGWFGLLPVRSPLLRESRLISCRRATEMFQFAHFPPSLPMCSAGGLQTSLWRGCPIRNLRAHRLYAAPPERFAGLRVLLRPSAPRHPPRTLCSLLFSHSWFRCDPLFQLLLDSRSAKLKIHPIQLFKYGCSSHLLNAPNNSRVETSVCILLPRPVSDRPGIEP